MRRRGGWRRRRRRWRRGQQGLLTSLGEEDVELSGHASRDGVDSEADFDAAGVELRDELGEGILSLGNGKAVAGYDHYALG